MSVCMLAVHRHDYFVHVAVNTQMLDTPDARRSKAERWPLDGLYFLHTWLQVVLR